MWATACNLFNFFFFFRSQNWFRIENTTQSIQNSNEAGVCVIK